MKSLPAGSMRRRDLLAGTAAILVGARIAEGKSKAPIACSAELPGAVIEYLLPAELAFYLVSREPHTFFDPEKMAIQGDAAWETLANVDYDFARGFFDNVTDNFRFSIDVVKPVSAHSEPIETPEGLQQYLRRLRWFRGREYRIADEIGVRAVIVGDQYDQMIAVPLSTELFARVSFEKAGREKSSRRKRSTGWIDAIRSSMQFRRR